MSRPQSAAIVAREVPILFGAPMIRAILAGTKTQTRRILKLANGKYKSPMNQASGDAVYNYSFEEVIERARWRIGDCLWVRETYYQFGHWEPIAGQTTRSGKRQKWRFVPDSPEISFDPPAQFRRGMHRADPATPSWHKRLGRFMPRRASRTALEVVAVRVERLQSISEADALAEGIEGTEFWRDEHPASICYSVLWNHINGPTSWDVNPWVAVVEFRRVEQRI